MATFFGRIAFLHALLIFSFSLSGYGFLRGVESLGINYGQVGNNLPPPERVLELLQSFKLKKARIYDTNPQILTAFANSGIELIVTVENEILGEIRDPQQALQWVSTRIKPYFPATRITGIAVGNEVFTGGDMTIMANLLPAMVSIHGALSYLPSAGCFKSELAGIMPQYLQFLANTKAPFWINAYPYFAYNDDPSGISLNYALLNPNSGMIDPYTKLHYDNMLYAQVDAVIFAAARMGFGGLEVRVSETGWPSKALAWWHRKVMICLAEGVDCSSGCQWVMICFVLGRLAVSKKIAAVAWVFSGGGWGVSSAGVVGLLCGIGVVGLLCGIGRRGLQHRVAVGRHGGVWQKVLAEGVWRVGRGC
ncbi:Glucan endo-1,3-beta-glucosidase 11 [Camellia lanceoleosa]|uniref:Glucan endo-1,3-beta-glucosidase 11 n=1 Tax=Camellia lanceoleosa TaxID=1840588 RepID=A0ACC0GHU9_9ERIC|nr:Glucan endo-1,3-beta-glucosidase 11 [Camellia lanceoleosa]